ncbi:Endo-1,4-beta-xylanase A precursor [compost metagenome]
MPAIINPDALWDYRYVETAAREGIIRGTQPRTFEPNSYLTREEAAVILARARELKLETDTNKINATLQKTFKDYGNVTFYARASVIAIAKKGYIQGSLIDPNNKKSGYVFEPKSNLLRSDASIIVGKMLADLKRLPKING